MNQHHKENSNKIKKRQGGRKGKRTEKSLAVEGAEREPYKLGGPRNERGVKKEK